MSWRRSWTLLTQGFAALLQAGLACAMAALIVAQVLRAMFPAQLAKFVDPITLRQLTDRWAMFTEPPGTVVEPWVIDLEGRKMRVADLETWPAWGWEGHRQFRLFAHAGDHDFQVFACALYPSALTFTVYLFDQAKPPQANWQASGQINFDCPQRVDP